MKTQTQLSPPKPPRRKRLSTAMPDDNREQVATLREQVLGSARRVRNTVALPVLAWMVDAICKAGAV